MRKYTVNLNGKRVANPDLVSEEYYKFSPRLEVIRSLLKELNFIENGNGIYTHSKDSGLRVELPYSNLPKLDIEYGDVKREIWFDGEDGSFRDYNFVNSFLSLVRECWRGVKDVG